MMKFYILFLCIIDLAIVVGAAVMAYFFNNLNLLWWWVVPALSVCFTSFTEKPVEPDQKNDNKNEEE